MCHRFGNYTPIKLRLPALRQSGPGDAISCWGAHAPSRAYCGASPHCFEKEKVAMASAPSAARRVRCPIFGAEQSNSSRAEFAPHTPPPVVDRSGPVQSVLRYSIRACFSSTERGRAVIVTGIAVTARTHIENIGAIKFRLVSSSSPN